MGKHTEIDHSDAAKIEDLQMINADLLAALESMIEYDSGTPDDVLNAAIAAIAAIAKAKGQ